MKNSTRLAGLFAALSLLFGVAACAPQADLEPSPSPTGTDPPPFYNLYPVEFPEVAERTDMQAFWEETRDQVGQGSVSHDGPLDEGFVKCVYYTVKVNGVSVPTYSTRCGYDVHSFAWLDVETNAELALDFELTFPSAGVSQCVILPEKLGIAAEVSQNKVTAVLNTYGSISFVFDDKPEMALTLYVAPYEEFAAPDGYSLTELEPGVYTREQTTFTESSRVYYLKKGVYDVSSISLPNDSLLYLEPGAHIRVYEEGERDYSAAIQSSGTRNVRVAGRGILDFSKCVGGDAKTKGAFSFSNAEDLDFSGVISVNSHTWTLCFSNCSRVSVSRCMLFGYRTYSDGVMLSDCKDSRAEACFVRTGDDAMEVKSMHDSSNPDCYTDGVVFEDNCVWTDKGIAYGCIYEAKHDVRNVRFVNNSVGFAQASWSEHLGCCVMQMGSNRNAVWEDVSFENIEVYETHCSLLSVFNRANNAAEGGMIKNISFQNITAKKFRQTNLPVYALSVVIVLKEDALPTNSRIGALYLDDIRFGDTRITAANYEDFLNLNLAKGVTYAKKNIKIDTRSKE